MNWKMTPCGFVACLCATAHGSAQSIPGASQVPVLIDRTGNVVGPMLDADNVVITLNDKPYQVRLHPDGFKDDNAVIYYTSKNCKGVRYVPIVDFPATAFVANQNGTFIAPGDPIETISVNSEFHMDRTEKDGCHPLDQPRIKIVGSFVSVDINRLQIQPPFRIENR